MYGTVFHHYQHPEEPPPPSEPPESAPKRGRGRPKGSKNKRKASEVAHSEVPAPDPVPAAATSSKPPQKKARIASQPVADADVPIVGLPDINTSTTESVEGGRASNLIRPLPNLVHDISTLAADS
ncbi:hypothetical protein R3P38DRAFT_2776096 [Favolaschia claudopus]|uniref:Uncharacterized protein n=1 Tax=Favolaschia claudopus TaxID=2862362 RepID=A0AAW0BPT8_9AGAR